MEKQNSECQRDGIDPGWFFNESALVTEPMPVTQRKTGKDVQACFLDGAHIGSFSAPLEQMVLTQSS